MIKYILIWLVTGTGGNIATGSAEFDSYEACREAGLQMNGTGKVLWQWNCLPAEVKPKAD